MALRKARGLTHRAQVFAGFDTGGAAARLGVSERSSSTAWRKLTPSERITQSIGDPPVRHAPRQCHRFFDGVITKDGSRR